MDGLYTTAPDDVKPAGEIVELDSPLGEKFGFTSDKFQGYLWARDDLVIISFITSLQEGEGNLSGLFQSIRDAGYRIQVPTPLPGMREILTGWGFKPRGENDPLYGYVEIWEEEEK